MTRALDMDTVTASRALDVSFVIDQLTHGNTAWRLAHLIDKHEIGMAGHSIGGAAAATTMIADPRVLAGVDMDGAFHPVPMLGQINRPFLMLGGAGVHSVGGATPRGGRPGPPSAAARSGWRSPAPTTSASPTWTCSRRRPGSRRRPCPRNAGS